jgi:hypothetical protein
MKKNVELDLIEEDFNETVTIIKLKDVSQKHDNLRLFSYFKAFVELSSELCL